jgi:DNA-binding GntR family transcriptional regulator
VRALLESESARLAAGADVSNIRKAFDEAEKCLEELRYGEYSRLNLAFHQQIWKASGNDRMYHILMEMWNGLSLGSTASTAEYACTSLEEHREILYALESHDSEKSAGLMRSHIERSMNDMLTHYE